MVTDMIANLKSLNIQKEALISIAKTSEEYVELNREQLLDGRKADGKYMPAYSDRSVSEFGKPSGPIRLFDTGKFQKSFKLDVGNSVIQITADDPNDLAGAYGDEIFGLMPANHNDYIEYFFLPEFAAKIESQTGLKL